MKKTIKKIIYSILRLEAKIILWKYKPKIVAITGSVGKTSTKDAVFAVLSKFSYVRKAEKSYNTQIGIPLTVIGCPNGWGDISLWLKNLAKGLRLIILPSKYPQWLILEVGVGKPGDMRTTAGWFKSDAVIMTAIGETPVHIEFFNSRKHLVNEKSQLIHTLKRDGVLILNADDSTILDMKEKTNRRVFTYGFEEGADFLATDLSIDYKEDGSPKGLVWRTEREGNSLPVFIPEMFGRNHAYAGLASLAFTEALGFNLIEAIEALKNYTPPPGRMRLLEGINNSLIIDDSYNSSPYACIASLETLGQISSECRKVAVLGDMLELGKHTQEEHFKIGKLLKKYADVLMVVGPRAQDFKNGALSSRMKKGSIYEFNNSQEAGEFLKSFVQEKDLILIKGSQGMRMERVVEAIMKDQENKADLLIRQEPEWLAKK